MYIRVEEWVLEWNYGGGAGGAERGIVAKCRSNLWTGRGYEWLHA